ncbi:hypothetical protein [Daejeonella sp.]|uniref:hypothetical protein n=1 Tax=Daejeonella sp. TaxID=2805397 RepID=UPI00271C890F|nr:hypothetical protein [Daejeonella sp.]MDO8991654.1 hypothetical protein [Daejeonella sp.]MDP2413857.1 hypothetical protein [Daejeonella sp.]
MPVLPSKIKEDSIEAKKYIHQWIKTTNKFLKRLGDDLELESPLTTYVDKPSSENWWALLLFAWARSLPRNNTGSPASGAKASHVCGGCRFFNY